MTGQNFKYFAFISYNSKDTEWGKRVQKKLEGYKMPATLCSEHGWERKPIKPVFFAPTDIQPGGLTAELQERLKASKNLIVICSPNSARSEWVGKEIEFFHSLGRTKQIHFFIVDGEPHSGNPDSECFNPVVNKLGLPEILGANIHEQIYRWPWLNKERAYVQLITKLLGVEFDSIWQRHKRQLIQKTVAWTIGALLVLAAMLGLWLSGSPVDVSLTLQERSTLNSQLPPLKDAVVTMMLDNETKTDTVASMNDVGAFKNIPRRFLNQEVRLLFVAQNFVSVDTTLLLSKDVVLAIKREPSVFGNVHFRLWNPNLERPVKNAKVEIAGQTVTSDDEGIVSAFIPLESQRPAYSVKASLALENDTIFMPCGQDDVILTK